MYVYSYVCIVFSMVRSRAHLRITLTARRTANFTQAGVALTNAADSSIAPLDILPAVEEKETNQREGGSRREKPDRMSQKYKKKKKKRLEVRIIYN